jgi:hypothetical protein
MNILDVARGVVSAVEQFAPTLAPNVIAACASTLLILWVGFSLSQHARRLLHFSWAPSDKFIDAILASYAWGALYALALMYALGVTGIYTRSAIAAAILLPIVCRGRHALTLPRPAHWSLWTALPFLVLATGPLLISLTNPMPSWVDVLEGNVAPVQRLITFSSFDPGSALPSALYSNTRATPLYTAVFGASAKLFGRDAYQILAASLVPTLLLLMLAAYRLGSSLAPKNKHAGWLAASSIVLAHNYIELQSARSTIWQMIFSLAALAKAVDVFENPREFRSIAKCALFCAAAVLAHPFEGAFTTLTVLLLLPFSLIGRGKVLQPLLAGVFVGAGLGAPLLWSWWPHSMGAITLSLFLLLMTAFLVRRSREVPGYEPTHHSDGVPRWVVLLTIAVVILSTLFLNVDSIAGTHRSFLAHAFVRYPVPVALTIALLSGSLIGRFQKASLLTALAIAAASLPIWLLPYLHLRPVDMTSFSYELPLKGLVYWLSTVLAVTGSLVLSELWARSDGMMLLRAATDRTIVLALLVLPISTILPFGSVPVTAAAGFFGAVKWQARVITQGYWAGWGNARWIVSNADRDLFDYLKTQVDSGMIKSSDRVAHVAEGSNLRAVPFPAFTGITQDLYLPGVDTLNIHTHGGRLYDIRKRQPPCGWVLVERSMLRYFRVDTAAIKYQNARAILSHTRDANPSLHSASETSTCEAIPH